MLVKGMTSQSGQITRLLSELREGNREAEQQLIPIVLTELHRMAKHYMRGENAEHTLQPTALVNEVYLRLAGGKEMDFKSRSHFFGTAARLMRSVLIDHARTRNREKRGGGNLQKVPLESAFVYSTEQAWQMVALDDALKELEQIDERQCRIVECRFFAGLSVEETAAALGVSVTTVHREWSVARAWLHRALSESRP